MLTVRAAAWGRLCPRTVDAFVTPRLPQIVVRVRFERKAAVRVVETREHCKVTHCYSSIPPRVINYYTHERAYTRLRVDVDARKERMWHFTFQRSEKLAFCRR